MRGDGAGEFLHGIGRPVRVLPQEELLLALLELEEGSGHVLHVDACFGEALIQLRLAGVIHGGLAELWVGAGDVFRVEGGLHRQRNEQQGDAAFLELLGKGDDGVGGHAGECIAVRDLGLQGPGAGQGIQLATVEEPRRFAADEDGSIALA